ncbi:MAG: hypothetical protein AB8H86_28280 [Polyangiales bacterium]
MRFPCSAFALVVLAACGSKTEFIVPSFDAGPELDASADVPIDVPAVRDSSVPPPRPDICVELPLPAPPTFVDSRFVARIASADVLFLVDVTGSMLDEIRQIQASLREVIVPGLIAEIPDVSLSVAEFADFPVLPYGAETDEPFRIRQPSTTDIGAVQRGVGRLAERSGGDPPESHVEALWQAATGRGIPGELPPAMCANGEVGYPCFRENGSRIILLFTDAEFHNGPGGSQMYAPGSLRPPPATYEQTVGALRTIGARVLGLYSGGFGGDALRDLRSIATDTGAVTPDGQPIVFDIGQLGEDLGEGVIDVVRTLVQDVLLDVDAVVEDAPFDGVDATEFVVGVETLGARPRDGASDLGDRYVDVQPGTEVAFRFILDNTRFEPGPVPVSYFLTIVLRGDGVTRLRETLVEIVIPAIDGTGCPVVDG